MSIIDWVLVGIGVVVFLGILIAAFSAGSSSYGEAQVRNHAAQQQLGLNQHRFEVHRDAERVRREIDNGLR